MYAQQMAKGKAALQRGVYSDILSKFDASRVDWSTMISH